MGRLPGAGGSGSGRHGVPAFLGADGAAGPAGRAAQRGVRVMARRPAPLQHEPDHRRGEGRRLLHHAST
ncbi:hypothetical protein AQF52_6724 [Streptomyces venezuelae]|nr:hypothetical protein AQF52_6724 [Streptomyces venezuelae]